MAKTLWDIARTAGCSAATVSRVINNQGQVSSETREAILRALKSHRFQPRTYKRSRGRTPSEPTVGLIEVVLHLHTPMERVSQGDQGLVIERLRPFDPDHLFDQSYRLSNSFYLRIVDGIMEESLRWGYRTTLTPNRDLLDPVFLEEINREEKAGAIVLGTYDENLPRFATKCARPLVFADLVFGGCPFSISFDNASGIAQAMEHILELGHRRIGFVAGPEAMTGFRERLAAFRAGMSARGLPVREEEIYTGSNHMEHVTAWAAELLKKNSRPTAILCGNDFIALGVQRAARELGLRIPQQLSLVGFDDIDAAALVDPPLTTVRVPTLELGRCAVRQLMLQCKTGRSQLLADASLRLPTRLVVRSSTAKLESN